jgi:hypothetical protein
VESVQWGVGMQSGETSEAAEICDVQCKYVIHVVHIHGRRQPCVVHLNSRDGILDDNSPPLPVDRLVLGYCPNLKSPYVRRLRIKSGFGILIAAPTDLSRVYTPAKEMSVIHIQAKTPIGKTIGGIFFGCISLLAFFSLVSPLGGSYTGRIIVGVVFGLVSAKWLSSAYKHQQYLQDQSDKLNRINEL